MRIEKLDRMVKGWFVGAFDPTVFQTDACEVGLKKYNKGDVESRHYHKIATEITLVISGTIKMNGKIFNAGDIIVLEPGEDSDFEAVTDAVNVVVKLPGALNDKYLGVQN